jgi:hypothetical protein
MKETIALPTNTNVTIWYGSKGTNISNMLLKERKKLKVGPEKKSEPDTRGKSRLEFFK